MKLLKRIFSEKKKKSARFVDDYYQQSVNRIGAEQFQRLIKRGLQIPVFNG